MDLKNALKLIEAIESPAEPTGMPFKIGKNYFIRTVTMYYTGQLIDVKGQWLILSSASWIADTGRFHDFLKSGTCNEYESFIDLVYIPITAVIDITEWTHQLFRGQK